MNDKKIEKELSVIQLMIDIYCRGKHGKGAVGHCEECRIIRDYATQKIYKCPNRQTKKFCSSCKTHCYSPDMRQKIREVMKYSGPRMIFHRPDLVLKHMWDTFKNKRR